MKGEKIKEILKAEGFALSEVARLLGFDNDQRLHSALRSDDVKTGLVEDIARVTNKSICLFFGLPAEGSTSASDHSVAVSGNSKQTEQTSCGEKSPNIKGNGNHVNSSDAVVSRVVDELSASREVVLRTLDEVSAQRSLVEQSLAQNASLIALLQSIIQKS
ncbi:MAG: hypothetical protein ACI4BC_10110 [Muribaculaceae bacterium]